MGPFITPKSSCRIHRSSKIRFTLNGQVMQEPNTTLMIHNVYEQVPYASNIMTLGPAT